MTQNCNRCNIGMRCMGESNMEKMMSCKRFKKPYDAWKLAEMALVNPTGLSEALSGFPFRTDINTYLKGRE